MLELEQMGGKIRDTQGEFKTAEGYDHETNFVFSPRGNEFHESNGCNDCVEVCPIDVFIPAAERGDVPIILHPEECWYCGCCVNQCGRDGAIKIASILAARCNRPELSRVDLR